MDNSCVICIRCHKEILDTDEVEYIHSIPRLGVVMPIHKICIENNTKYIAYSSGNFEIATELWKQK